MPAASSVPTGSARANGRAPAAVKAEAGGSGAGPSGSRGGGGPSLPPRPAGDSQLWVQKHRPKASTDLCGNPGHVATLREWLRNWCAPATARKSVSWCCAVCRVFNTLDLDLSALMQIIICTGY